jgi:pimeloyl-ACP methyl ester carboxylesterase
MTKPSIHFSLATLLSACLALNAVHANEQAQSATTGKLTATPGGSNRASMETMQIPSHGSLMNALVYVAAGAGPHPAVILLHGFPGNERNLDLAQDMRRAGWDVLYFDYRGSWGTPGNFSFSHGIEDTAAALNYLQQPEVAKKLRLDPRRIVLIGHSMGGFMAVEAAAKDPAIKAFATISAADFGGRFLKSLDKNQKLAAHAVFLFTSISRIQPHHADQPHHAFIRRQLDQGDALGVAAELRDFRDAGTHQRALVRRSASARALR